MTWNEARTYIPWEKHYQRSQDRKAQQRANKRKSFPLQEEQHVTGMIRVTRMVLHHQQHPHHGGHDIDECRLLTIEDSTAERQFYCIVFQLAADFTFHLDT